MRKVVIVSCLIAIACLIYYVSSESDNQDDLSSPEDLTIMKPDSSEIQKKKLEEEQDLRRQQMKDRFAELKEFRKKIKMRLSRLSSRLRRTEFPSDQAKVISQNMRRGNYFLKNPKLLGAFSNIEEIDREFEQLSEINMKLDGIKQILDEKKKNKL